jgi:hypothetical protein
MAGKIVQLYEVLIVEGIPQRKDELKPQRSNSETLRSRRRAMPMDTQVYIERKSEAGRRPK